jgi:hypothetical protein
LLNIGAEIARGKKRISRDEWRCVGLYEEKHLDRLESPIWSRYQLTIEVRRWLADVGFSLQWSRERKEFGLEIDFRGRMLAAVGLQLALTLSNSDNLYVCSGCAYPYARPATKRSPKTGQANFCEDCGLATARRQADARRKKKMQDAKRLAAENLSVPEIAAQLDTTPASVRRWLRKG